jgi:hypothetical protein
MTVRSLVRRMCVGVFVAVMGYNAVQYVFDARARAKAHECISVTSQNGLYLAESCVTDADGNLVFYVGKLYEARGGALLARTDFDSMDGGAPEFMPDESAVVFKGGDAGIDIPPKWLDRLRAKIP